jgi:HAD superfamily hydrolase (TIGR01509 family)
MSSFNTILFDLDGVLVDACDWHYEALNESLNEILGIKITKEDHENKFNGLPTKVKLDMLGIKEETQQKIWNLKQQKTISIIEKNKKQDESKIELLTYLKDNNFKIGCVTNSIKETAQKMLLNCGILNYFDILVTNELVQKNKPFPEPYLFAMEKLQVNPNSCICVEDSDKGINSAINSNCGKIWIVNNAKEVNLYNYKLFMDEL